MAQKFTVPITVKQLASAGSDAVTVFVDQDTFSRLKVEAGGRLTWGSGASAGDVNLYRASADVLQTDDTFKTPILFVDSIEIDPTGATTNQVLQFDGTKFTAATIATGGGAAEFTSQVKHTVKNDDSVTLTKGMVVYTSGANGTNILVKRAGSGSETTSAQVLGFVEADIAVNGTGYVVNNGLVAGINTSDATAAGDPIWLSSNVLGGVVYGIANKPNAPNHLVYLGVVTKKNPSTGEVFVHISNGWELDELHNVTAASPTAGDFLKYNGTIWVNDAIDLGTDTNGNYVQNLVAGTGITLTNGTASEGGTPTVAVTANTYQPLDADLTSIAGLAGTSGFLKKTAADTWSLDTATHVTTSDTGSVTSAMILDGTIVNGDINASAAIVDTKLATIATVGKVSNSATTATNANTASAIVARDASGNFTAGTITASLTGNASTVTNGVYTTDTGTVTSAMIADGTIVNGDINASAAIALSKLASGTSGQVIVANSGGVPTYVTPSGDVTWTNAGVTSIGTGKVTSTMILDGTIIDADISTSAAIALSKLSTTGASAGNVVTYNGSAWTAASASSGGSTVTASTTPPASPSTGSIWFDSNTAKTYVYYDSFWVEIGGTSGGAKMYVSLTAPSSPAEGQLWFKSDTAQTFAYYDSFWVEVGAAGMSAIAADIAPASPVSGQIWFNSSTGGTYVYYDSYWIEIGAVAANTIFNLVDAKGDLLLGTADNTLARQAVGTNGQLLQANSATTTGVQWVTPTYAPLADPTFTGTVTIPAGASITLPSINNFILGYTTTATAGGTTTLTNTSNNQQVFTGTLTQTVVMPVASTMGLGTRYVIENNSTGTVTVNSSGSNLITTIPSGMSIKITCILTSGTTAASWDAEYVGFNSITGTGSSVLSVSPTFTGTVTLPATSAVGTVSPSATNTYDLGTASLRWRNIYTQDLHLSNGVGDYTVIEGEENLYLVNNKTNKSFKFALIEVDRSEVPKASDI